MKKKFLRSLTLASVLVGCSALSAFAQDVAPAKDSDAAKLTPSLFIRSRYSMYDSSRNANFGFFHQTFKAGLSYSQGEFFGKGVVEYKGNVVGQYPTGNVTKGGGNGVGIDQAYVGMNVVQSEPTTVAFILGRFQPTGANVYGGDAIYSYWGISGYDPQDGVFVQYSGNMGSTSLTAQFGVSNAMPIWIYGDGGPTNNAKSEFWDIGGSSSIVYGGWGAQESSSDHAYVANVSANVKAGEGTVELVAAYARQDNAITGVKTVNNVNSASEGRDTQYLEASAGYNLGSLAAGAWFTWADFGETKTDVSINSGTATFRGGDGLKDQYYIAGLGVNGDSKLFGMTDVVVKGGVLTYGAGVQMYQHRQSGTNALSDSDEAKNDVTLISAEGGFKKGAFSMGLNLSYFMADNDVFHDSSDKAYKNNAFVTYLVGKVSL